MKYVSPKRNGFGQSNAEISSRRQPDNRAGNMEKEAELEHVCPRIASRLHNQTETEHVWVVGPDRDLRHYETQCKILHTE